MATAVLATALFAFGCSKNNKGSGGDATTRPAETTQTPTDSPATTQPTVSELVGHWCLSSFPQSHKVSYYSEASIETMYKEHNNTFIEFKADGTYFLFHASVTAFTGSAIEKGNYSVHGNSIHFTNSTGMRIWNYDKPDLYEQLRSKMAKLDEVGISDRAIASKFPRFPFERL